MVARGEKNSKRREFQSGDFEKMDAQAPHAAIQIPNAAREQKCLLCGSGNLILARKRIRDDRTTLNRTTLIRMISAI